MTIGLMAWMVMAGSAAQAGAAGVGVGNAVFTVTTPTPPCSAFDKVELTVGQTGTYSATDPATGSSASYTGASTMKATVTSTLTATYYEGPLGTHGTDSTCSPLTAGTVVPATVEVSGSMTGGSVNCGSVTGDYSRTHGEVTVEATHTCTVNSGPVSANEAMTQRSIGLYDTCSGGGPPTGCTYKGSFTT